MEMAFFVIINKLLRDKVIRFWNSIQCIYQNQHHRHKQQQLTCRQPELCTLMIKVPRYYHVVNFRGEVQAGSWSTDKEQSSLAARLDARDIATNCFFTHFVSLYFNCAGSQKRRKAGIHMIFSLQGNRSAYSTKEPLVPVLFLSSIPVHEMTFPFLSNRNTLWTPSCQTSRHFFSENYRLAVFSIFHAAVFSSISSLWCPF